MTPEQEAELRYLAEAASGTLPVHDVRQIFATLDAARVELADVRPLRDLDYSMCKQWEATSSKLLGELDVVRTERDDFRCCLDAVKQKLDEARSERDKLKRVLANLVHGDEGVEVIGEFELASLRRDISEALRRLESFTPASSSAASESAAESDAPAEE